MITAIRRLPVYADRLPAGHIFSSWPAIDASQPLFSGRRVFAGLPGFQRLAAGRQLRCHWFHAFITLLSFITPAFSHCIITTLRWIFSLPLILRQLSIISLFSFSGWYNIASLYRQYFTLDDFHFHYFRIYADYQSHYYLLFSYIIDLSLHIDFIILRFHY